MRNALLVLLLAATVTACGLKGPLYLPEQKPAVAAPPAAVAPGIPAEDKKTPGAK